ncbi:S-layer homology domain-containing protein [Paenibacillus thiaminolyticus]|uniref:S-layer homology domain-containing protein n=1 Tax=Paenibacillus thiaminolyticus TaxID=49283 RepID=UPI002543BA9F|nr:S-layer homology domain-containing protein [Paenibacillus thiaminolyticus]WII37256.1 S-layer homology domain-containing protein [Paenibacillus thiaminolyticus]
MREMSYQSSKQDSQQTKQFRGGDKKVMKKRLALLLSVAMAFSMFANVAFGADAAKTTQEKFDVLKDAGIFSGYPGTNDAKLEQNLTRAEFAKVVVKALGLKEVEGVYSYKDKNYGPKHWAAKYIEAVTAEGLMQGINTSKQLFGTNDNITVQEAAKVLVLGYKFDIPEGSQNNASDWAKDYFQAAVDAGLFSKDANPKANATRGQLVEAVYAADELSKGPKVESAKVIDARNVEVTMSDKEVVKVELKAEEALKANVETEIKFEYKGKEYTTKVTYVVTSAQKIESVTAENLKEVVVTFDGTVEEKTAENKNNYEVKDMKIDSVTLSSDKRSVAILLEENGSVMTNQKETEVKIKNVRNEDGSKTFNETKKFTPVDVKTPEIKEVVGLGTKAFKVVFSEPVKRGDAVASSNYKVDGKMVAGSVDYMYPNVAIVKTDLSVGEHKLSVSNITDFSGLKSIPVDMEFTVAEDTAAPEIVSAKTNDLDELEIEFNETVRSIEKVYHNASANAGKITYKDNKVKVTFSNKMYNGDNTIYVKGVSDYSGNKADREIKVNPTLDSTRPEIVKLEVKEVGALNNHQLVLEFNKKLDKATATNPDNYTLKDRDGKVLKNFNGVDEDGHPVSVPTYNENDYKVTINLNGKLANETDYILEVVGVRDMAALQNTIVPWSQTFTAKQTAKTGIVRAWFTENYGEQNLYVQFKENMRTDGDGSVLIKEKYLFNGKSITDHEITMMSGDTVRITAKSDKPLISSADLANPDKVYDLSVSQVKNASGDYIKNGDSFTLTYSGKLADAYANTVAVKEAKVVSRNEVRVEFGGKINRVVLDDFKVKVGDNYYAPSEYDLSNDGAVLTLKFNDAKLPSVLTGGKLVVRANPGTYDVLNVPVKSGETDLTDVDTVRPEIVKGSLNVTKTATSATYEARIQATSNLHATIKDGVEGIFDVTVNNGQKAVQSVTKVERSADKSILVITFTMKPDAEGKVVSLNKDDFITVTMRDADNKVNKYIVSEFGDVPLAGFTASANFTETK